MRWIKRLWRKLFKRSKPVVGIPNPISPTVADWFTKSYTNAAYQTSRFQKVLENIDRDFFIYFARYEAVKTLTGVPSEVICAIHHMECGGRWDKVLHNGQTLKHVEKYGTTWVPKGRGKGKYWSWETAAIDALNLKKGSFPKEWTISATLDFLERYNGTGYRRFHTDVNTPYLWSGTQYYIRGKYVSDGKFDKNAVSGQVGCVAILKTLGYK